MAARRRRKPTQVHEVNMSMQAWDLAKAGAAVTIEVRRQKRLIGTTQIGQGRFRWKRAGGKSGFTRIRWGKLADRLNEMI